MKSTKQLTDMRSTLGIMLRGKNVYNGGSSSSNPMGNNGSTTPDTARKLLERRKRYGINNKS